MKKVKSVLLYILIILVLLLSSSFVLGDYSDLCSDRLQDKYPAMSNSVSLAHCKKAMLDIDIDKVTGYSFDDKLLFLEEIKKDEILKLRQKDILKIFTLKGIPALNEIDPSNIKYFSKLSRAEIEIVFENLDVDIDELLADNQLFRDDILDKRTISSEIKEISRKKYLLSKQKFLQSKKEYLKARNNFNINKDQLKFCSVDCDAIQTKLQIYSKEFLIQYSIMIESLLNKVISQIESDENIDIKDADDILNELNSHLEKIQEIEAAINTANTKSKVKDFGKEISEVWVKISPSIRRTSGIIIGSRLGEVVINSQRLEQRLNLIIANLKYQGVDIKIDDYVNELSSETLKLQKLYMSSRVKYKKAKYSYDNEEILKTADSELLIGNKHINIIRDIISNILLVIKHDDSALYEFERSDIELEVREVALYVLQ